MGKTILLIDDDFFIQEVIKNILESNGYNVICFENPLKALENESNISQADLIISDMNMPKMSGIDFFKQIKSKNINKPFILLTGDLEEVKSIKDNFSDCLLKDDTIDEKILNSIKKILT